MPIGHSGVPSASRAVIVFQSSASASVVGWSTVISPHWWLSSWATVASPLPLAANSGQYVATFSS